MKSNSLLSRRAGLVLLGIVLLAAFVFVVARTGPFAPTRVTVVKVAEGSVAPELFGIGTVEARRAYLIGPDGRALVAYPHDASAEGIAADLRWLLSRDS